MSQAVGRLAAVPPHGESHSAGTVEHLHSLDGAGGDAYPQDGTGEHSHQHLHLHEHPHPHDQQHSHDAGASAQPRPSEARPTRPSQGVFVDVGEGVGALVLYADADREWLEPEIHPVDEPDRRQHVWVLERVVASGSVYAAVFPSLPEGRYGVCSPAGVPASQEIVITGGKVTEARWL
jgi:hypothetical protein